MDHFLRSVNNHQNTCATPILWKIYQEVHCQVSPWYINCWYWLKLPLGCNILHLSTLTHIALTDVCFYFFSHGWESISPGKIMESPVDAQVAHVVMIFQYDLCFHGGWQHHSHLAKPGIALNHKVNNVDPFLPQGIAVARG